MKQQTTALVAAAVLLLAALVPYSGATAPSGKASASLGKAAFKQKPIIDLEEPEPLCTEEAAVFSLAWEVADDAALLAVERKVVFDLTLTDPLTEEVLGHNATEVVYRVTPFEEESGETPLTVTLHFAVLPRSVVATVAVQVYDGGVGVPSQVQSQSVEIDAACNDCPKETSQPTAAAAPPPTSNPPPTGASFPMQNGIVDWTIGATQNLLCRTGTPMLPVWIDLGNVSLPFRTWHTGDTEECRKDQDGWNGWGYKFTTHAALQPASYKGALPFNLGYSSVQFWFNSAVTYSKDHGNLIDGVGFNDSERQICNGALIAKKNTIAAAEAHAWGVQQVSGKLTHGVGQVNYLQQSTGQPTYTLGPMSGPCTLTLEKWGGGWAFTCDFFWQGWSPGVQAVAHVNGRSLLT